jgi:hypothetical protein
MMFLALCVQPVHGNDAGDKRSACGRRAHDRQIGAHHFRPVLHDLQTNSGIGSGLLGESAAVVEDCHSHTI